MTDDMHAHRRHQDDDDVTGYRLQAATESTMAKALARFGVPLLLTAVSVLGGIAFNDLKKDTNEGSAERRQVSQDVSQIKSDVRDLNTRLDAQVIRQVDQNTKRLETHEARIQTLERSVKTP